tara:strand:- start:54724 stop:54870 length:147 start_codon:yes stop_codon:yes gene_type:complete
VFAATNLHFAAAIFATIEHFATTIFATFQETSLEQFAVTAARIRCVAA